MPFESYIMQLKKGRAEKWSQEKFQLGPHPWIPPIHLIIRLVINSSSLTSKYWKEKYS